MLKVKWPVIAIACLMVLIALTGCSSKNETKTKTEMTVLMDWYPNAVHSFLFSAEENGHFAAEGLKVNLRAPADPNDPLKLVAADKMELGISYQNQVVTARSQGLPVISLGAIVRQPLTQLMVADNSEIRRPRDLEGKRIGYSSLELYRTFVKEMVERDGGDPNKVKFIDIGYNLINSMINKNVDGIMGGFINHEEPILKQKGMKIRIIKGVDYGIPDYYELVLIANEDAYKKNPAKYESFVRAMRNGYQDMVNDPQTSLNLVLAKQNKKYPLKADIEKASLDILLPLMDAKQEPFATQSLDSWKQVSDWMYSNKAIQKPVDPAKAFINIQSND